MRPLPVVPLATERLLLEEPTHDDVEAIVLLANDPEVVRRLSRLPHPYTEADARFFLDEVVPNEADWKVSLRAAGEMVGIIGLRPQAPNTHCLGYWYGRRYWGQGYATEAARAVVDYAFGCDFVHGLASGHFQDNHASAHVLRKLGFVETGRSSRQCRFLGHDLPHVDMERPRPQP